MIFALKGKTHYWRVATCLGRGRFKRDFMVNFTRLSCCCCSCCCFSCHGNHRMLLALFVSCIAACVVVVVSLVIQESTNVHPAPAIKPVINQFGNSPSIKPSTAARDTKRWNVIILTHMSSGSTFTGNLFNLHPDVFYLYEPLHNLRRGVYGNEWNPFDEATNDEYKSDFSTLFRDVFDCGFREDATLKRAIPPFVRSLKRLTYWRYSSPEFTKETVRKACKAKKLTVAKVMQTRLPRNIGIQELQRVCSADPARFDCLIIHLVRDPRAVVSSLLGRKFFIMGGPKKRLLTSSPLTTEGRELVRQHAELMCSQVSNNIIYAKENWLNWFKGRYKVIRYEDIVANAVNKASELYNFVGLSMVESIYKWIVEGEKLVGTGAATFTVSENDVNRIDHWRFDRDSSLISLFEEACAPLMKLTGYIFVNGSEHLQHNLSKPLLTKEMPILKDLPL